MRPNGKSKGHDTTENPHFCVADCAFLRTSQQSDGSETYSCLLQKGQECTEAQGYPYGAPCAKAVINARVDKEHRARYWKSLRKHTMLASEVKKGAFQGKSTRREEYLFCKRKCRYSSEKIAKQVKKMCEEQRGIPLRVLYCPFCKGWHLTHKYAKPHGDESSST